LRERMDVNEKKDRFAIRIIYAVGDTFVAYTTRFVNSRTQNAGDIGVLCRNLDV